MKRTTIVALALCGATVASNAMAQNQYGWTLSASDSDPYAHEADAAPGPNITVVFVWLACSTGDGLAAAEMGLSLAPLTGITTMNGFLNASTQPSTMLLAGGGCPQGPVLVGSLLYLDTTGEGIDVCLVPSEENGYNLSVDCTMYLGWDNDFIGFSSAGNPPCQTPTFCDAPVSVEDVSWGGVKGLYR